MEPEVLGEKIEWEARRIAAAFRVEQWKVESRNELWIMQGSGMYGEEVLWAIDLCGLFFGARVVFLEPQFRGKWAGIHRDERHARQECWFCQTSPLFSKFLVLGLYRLGFEDEAVLAKLNYPLSAHEKLELRLSMPHEFWPQKWQEEIN